ncbi:hypothetical protein PIB30_100941 [Stylosanthes scabra]|uniref:Retrotransposon gag domain-containing protein n=1 Tax=Stylosanthes scabra TaxID=79078 RepID=A0ABU6UY34_9FABA|nr:hypothetical protein [Stylosanthes scabra]
MSGRGRGNRRGVAASPASDIEQPDLANDFAEIAAALRESAVAMRETNGARERERESHVNGDGSTAGNRVVTLAEFMKLRPPQFSGTNNPSKADDWFDEMERALRAQQVPEGQQVEFAAQGGLSLDEYVWKFEDLFRFSQICKGDAASFESWKCMKFEAGLKDEIQL